MIDLCKMRAVRVDTEKNLIIAQGGCLWEDVDKAGAEHGLATGLPLQRIITNGSWRNGQ